MAKKIVKRVSKRVSKTTKRTTKATTSTKGGKVTVAPKKRGRPAKVEVAPKKRGRPAKVVEAPKRKYTKRAKSTTIDASRLRRTQTGEIILGPKSKQNLVEETLAPAKSVAVTADELAVAKSMLNGMRSQDIEVVKRTFNATDRSEWNKWTHINVNGSNKKALTEAVAQALDI